MNGIWGKKIGMTQLFVSDEKLVPVTVIDLNNWVITGHKTVERDGYDAVQVSYIRPKYQDQSFDLAWLAHKGRYFMLSREIACAGNKPELGTPLTPDVLGANDIVDARGISIGRGFAGVIKRYGFSGGRSSHGGKLGRRPGSLSFMRRQGRVIKGKRMPGHYGVTQHCIRNITVVQVDPVARLVMIKGSTPGKAGSWVELRKRG